MNGLNQIKMKTTIKQKRQKNKDHEACKLSKDRKKIELVIFFWIKMQSSYKNLSFPTKLRFEKLHDSLKNKQTEIHTNNDYTAYW